MHMKLFNEEDSTAPFFDRKWRYILTYRLSRESNKPQAQLNRKVLHFLVDAGARFKIPEGWAKLDQFVFLNANINAVDNTGETLLHYAIQENLITTVDKLLAAGANTSATNKYGDTPLHKAVEGKRESVVDKLLSHPPSY